MNTTKTYTLDQVETAMAIWESLLENPPQWFVQLKAENGSCTARGIVAELAPHMDDAWSFAAELHGYDDAFDWAFVPDVLHSITSPAQLINDPLGVVNRLLSRQK
jgi:hypothetical protein